MGIMHPLNVTFFKGDRKYLQGGDIYNAINSIAPRLAGKEDSYLSKIIFRRFARNECIIQLQMPSEEDNLVASGEITSRTMTGTTKIWLLETNNKINERFEFLEDSIVAKSLFHDKQITLSSKTGFTPIEEIIALTKALNYALIPDVQGRWLFAQLKINTPLLVERKKLRIKQKSALASRFTVNYIFQDEIHIGEIRFIAGEP